MVFGKLISMPDFFIKNNKSLQNKILNIKKEGPNNFHILADFDRTLTRAYINNRPVTSLISALKEKDLLGERYSKKADKLHAFYYTLEYDHKLPENDRRKFMEEWWKKHFDLLIESKLNIKNIREVIDSDHSEFRPDFKLFFKIIYENSLPLVIMSASGLGQDSIELFFKKNNIPLENVYIISNELVWDKTGYLIKVKEPIIHSLNKDEKLVDHFPFAGKIIPRKNVLLLGDNIDDLKMVKGFKYNNLVTIGFYNDKNTINLELYKNRFDVVITNDGSFSKINDLLTEIFN